MSARIEPIVGGSENLLGDEAVPGHAGAMGCLVMKHGRAISAHAHHAKWHHPDWHSGHAKDIAQQLL